MSYGLLTGANIAYGAPGFPQWVCDAGRVFNLQASTYPGHQESERAETGFAPNPQHLNRGIDWAGTVPAMQRFAEYLLSIRPHLEQVIWQNPDTGQRVGVAGGDDVTTTPYYGDDYPNHTDHVHTRQSNPIPLPGGAVARPDFNEYALWSPNCQDRGGIKPTMFLLHTQEGPGNADSLARFLDNPANQVSYHYTISESPVDHGVTVCDVVDTDQASWSVLDYNNRSVNLCFAGSSASWTRAQWLTQSRAIDVAAYLAVQDCRKYGISMAVVPPPYKATPGISDHAYVTSRGIGTHTDVGPNFPWDVFAAAVAKYSGTAPSRGVAGFRPRPAPGAPRRAPAPPTPPVPAPTPSRTPWDQSALREVVALAKAGDARANLLLDVIEVVNPAALQQFIAKGS